MNAIEKEIYESESEWLNARRFSIGGSDVASIMGLNPWKTNIDLFNEKSGIILPKDISDDPLVKYGKQAEKALVYLFSLDYPEYEVLYDPNNMYKNCFFPKAHASIDAELYDPANKRKGVLEIKTTTIQSSIDWMKWDGRVPDNYYVQVLWYMIICEFDFAILKAQLKYFKCDEMRITVRHYFFERSDCINDMRIITDKYFEFLDCLERGKEPALILPDIF